MTNTDKIRRMTDEELAEYLYNVGFGFDCELCCSQADEDCAGRGCEKSILEWLRKEVDEE